MPNWCEDALTVTGPLAERQRMAREIRGDHKEFSENTTPQDPVTEFVKTLSEDDKTIEDLDFNKIIPVPEKILNNSYSGHAKPGWNDEKFNPDDCYGYDWCISHWGTKWNASEPALVVKKTRHVYYFQTAWSPPEPVVRALAAKYPKLTFQLKYWECGNGFKGTLTCKGSEELVNKTLDYHGNRGG